MKHFSPFKYTFMALCLILLCQIFVPSQANATSVVALTDDQLVEWSDCILHATVLDAQTVEYDPHTLLTRITVKVHESLKCDAEIPNSEFTFYTRGGTLGDISQTIPGEFSAAPNDEIVVFLEKIRRYKDAYMVLGLKQGAFEIEEIPMTRADKKSPKRIKKRHIPEAIQPPHMPESRFAQSETLSDLKAAIHQTIRSKEANHD